MLGVSNMVLVHFWRESGCALDEVSVSWKPINFMIYSDLFPDLIMEAADGWIREQQPVEERHYEVVFDHVIEHDGHGTVTSEYFEPVRQRQGE